MKKVILFLISFTYLSHQIIMSAQKTVNYQATQYLWNSIRNNNPIATQDAITQGADLSATDCFEHTTLMIAANNGYTVIVNILVHNNANLNAQDNFKKTALMYAANNGHTEIVRILINHKADVNAKDLYDKTGLIYATENGHTEIVRILVNNNANVNTATKYFNQTILMIAAEKGDIEIVRILVDNNADVNAENIHGKTALMYAAKYRHTKIAQILLDFGANPDQKDNDDITARKVNPRIIDEAILANRKNIIQYSQLASKFHENPTKPTNNAFLAKLFKHLDYEWKTSDELASLAQTQ